MPELEQAGFWPRGADADGPGVGFGAGGPLDDLVPGPELASHACQAAADLARLDDDQLVGVLRAARRLSSWSAAMELSAVAALAERRPAGSSRAAEHLADELAAALTLTRRGAESLLSEAAALAAMPATATALASGTIDAYRGLFAGSRPHPGDNGFVNIRPESVVAAAAVSVAALRPGVDADWSVNAGDLEWTVDRTIAHMTGAPAKYALYLSSRSARYIAVRVWPVDDATRQERLEAIEGCAAALAGVAATALPDAFGFHVTGMRNAAEFLAMACEELLVHTYDVTRGLELPYEPPDELCRLVIEHCYPGQDVQHPVWPFLVWLSGRRHPAATKWGEPPEPDKRSEVPLEFGRDPATGQWRATRWAAT